ncbi:hypothetical protein PPYR_10646 [Photinus pyralis]|uniref:Uncharacterized protein n=1 Tax=Photinus pyralis TaxID=7054 RepID=A0A5N4AGW7_PHOPY|nr:hypothetical protein PPYR_10646 [Photinus pyralis]
MVQSGVLEKVKYSQWASPILLLSLKRKQGNSLAHFAVAILPSPVRRRQSAIASLPSGHFAVDPVRRRHSAGEPVDPRHFAVASLRRRRKTSMLLNHIKVL